MLLQCIRPLVCLFLARPDKYCRVLRQLSLVSRTWASAIAGDAFLWSLIYVDEHRPLSTMELYIERSKNQNLSLYIHVGATSRFIGSDWWDPMDIRELVPSSFLSRWEGIIHMLRPHFARCDRLLLRADDEPSSYILMAWLHDVNFPRVTAAYLHLPTYSLARQRIQADDANKPWPWHLPTFGDNRLPELRMLTWHYAFALWKQTSVYDHLTRLSLKELNCRMAPSADEFFAVFKAAIRLTFLRLDNVVLDGNDLHNLNAPAASLPHLSHLSFSCNSAESICLLSFFRTPALRKLGLQLQDETLLPNLVHHCSTMLHDVESIVLQVRSVGVEDLAHLLEQTPNIHCFDARASKGQISLVFHAVIHHYHDFVTAPHLVTAYFSDFVDERVMKSMLLIARKVSFGDPLLKIAAASVPPMYKDKSIPTYHWLDSAGLLNRRPIAWSDNVFFEG